MPPKAKIITKKRKGKKPKEEGNFQNCKMPWATMTEQRAREKAREKAKERKRRSREKAKVRVKEEKQTKVEGKKKVNKNKLTSLCFMNPL